MFTLSVTNSDTLTAGAYIVTIEGAESGGTEHYYSNARGYFTTVNPRGGG